MKTPERKKKGTEEIFEVIMAENFPKLMRHPNHWSKMLREWHTGEIPKKFTPIHIIFKLQKTRDKEKTLTEARGGKHLTYRGIRKKITLASHQKPCKKKMGWHILNVERKIP